MARPAKRNPKHLRMSGLFPLKEILKMFVDLLGIAYRLRVVHWYQRPLSYNFASDEIADY
jgi:hypothetical protein